MDTASVDIKYSEITKWLEGRYFIPKDWAQRKEAAKIKMNELVEMIRNKKESDYDKAKKLLDKASLTYDDIVKIDKQLSKTKEGAVKNLFGYYSADFMKLSQLVLSILNKENVFLADYASTVVQGVGFELPSISKSIQFGERTVQDFQSKIKDKQQRISKLGEEKQFLFETHSLSATERVEEVHSQLVERLASLEPKLKEISETVQDSRILEGIKFYNAYSAAIGGKGDLLEVLTKANKMGDHFLASNTKISDYTHLHQKIKETKEKLAGEADLTKYKDISSEKDSLLLSRSVFTAFQTDVEELFIFFSQRKDNQEEDNILSMYHPKLSEVNKQLSGEKTLKTYETLERLVKQLRDGDLQFLLSILHNHNNVSRITDEFNRINSENIRLSSEISSLEKRIAQVNQEISEHSKKHKELRKEVISARRALEKAVTKLAKNRVSIIGDELLLD